MRTRRLNPVVDILVDVIVNVIYLLGVAVVELVLRPAFGASGVPPLANITLLVMDLILLFSLVQRLIKTLDQCVRELARSEILSILGRYVGGRRGREE